MHSWYHSGQSPCPFVQLFGPAFLELCLLPNLSHLLFLVTPLTYQLMSLAGTSNSQKSMPSPECLSARGSGHSSQLLL